MGKRKGARDVHACVYERRIHRVQRTLVGYRTAFVLPLPANSRLASQVPCQCIFGVNTEALAASTYDTRGDPLVAKE